MPVPSISHLVPSKALPSSQRAEREPLPCHVEVAQCALEGTGPGEAQLEDVLDRLRDRS